MMRYHLAAFITGFLLDLLFGDPQFLPHPVRMVGGLTGKLEQALCRGNHLLQKGCILAALTVSVTAALSAGLLFGSYRIHPIAGCILESVMSYQILALKDLRAESMKVYERLGNGTLAEARRAVSMIVGRDTACLDEAGVIRAAVETVAENTSDGVIAPMLYLAVGGPVLGFVYKAVSTMDSMIGYKNERYLYFGRAAAKLDDAANFIPSRICAGLMMAAAFLGGRCFDGKRAFRIYRRDRRKHASPNAAQTEAVCAGALGVRLAGNACYFGETVEKPCIGDDDREIEKEDIPRANRLLYITALLCEGICALLLWAVVMAA